jgi:hypothetical protein
MDGLEQNLTTFRPRVGVPRRALWTRAARVLAAWDAARPPDGLAKRAVGLVAVWLRAKCEARMNSIVSQFT